MVVRQHLDLCVYVKILLRYIHSFVVTWLLTAMSYDAQMPIKKQTHQTSDANKKYQQVLKSAKKKH